MFSGMFPRHEGLPRTLRVLAEEKGLCLPKILLPDAIGLGI